MKSNCTNRREFLARAITTGTGAALALSSTSWAAESSSRKKVKLSTPNAEKLGWRIGIEMYTFRDRTFYEALEVISNIGVRLVEPGYFLPLAKEHPGLTTSEALSPDMRREMKQRMADWGIKMPTYYGPLGADKNAYRKVFDFAKEMGVETIVAEPPVEALEALDTMFAEYKMKLAIHNHPEGSGSLYWNPDAFVKACEGHSPRIGGCPDTGHWVRSGLDTLESLKKYRNRINEVHLKDAEISGKRDSRDVPLGTGKAHYTALLQQLHDWKWRGVMIVEYEHLSPNLVPDVIQCVKFVEDFATNARK